MPALCECLPAGAKGLGHTGMGLRQHSTACQAPSCQRGGTGAQAGVSGGSEGMCVTGMQSQAVHNQFLKLTDYYVVFWMPEMFSKRNGDGAKSGSGWILVAHVNYTGHHRHLVFRSHKIPVVTSVRIVKVLRSLHKILLVCPSLFVL